MTDDFLHALDIIASLRMYQIHQVVVTAVYQKVLDVVGSTRASFLVLDLRGPCISVQSQ